MNFYYSIRIERDCELKVMKEFKWDSLCYRDEKEEKKSKLMNKLTINKRYVQ